MRLFPTAKKNSKENAVPDVWERKRNTWISQAIGSWYAVTNAVLCTSAYNYMKLHVANRIERDFM